MGAQANAPARSRSVTASAEDALALVSTTPFDVLVADIGMPNQDGYSLIRTIRGLPPSTGTIPAIAVTAYASLRDRDEALNAGFNAHPGKPFDPDLLVETVAAITTARRAS